MTATLDYRLKFCIQHLEKSGKLKKRSYNVDFNFDIGPRQIEIRCK